MAYLEGQPQVHGVSINQAQGGFQFTSLSHPLNYEGRNHALNCMLLIFGAYLNNLHEKLSSLSRAYKALHSKHYSLYHSLGTFLLQRTTEDCQRQQP